MAMITSPNVERDADLAERLGLGVDHDRAAAGEDGRDLADELGGEPDAHAPW